MELVETVQSRIERDKPLPIRVGSLIKCDVDGDIGIVTRFIRRGSHGVLYIKVWWHGEQANDPGSSEYIYEPWLETVMRY